MYFGRYLAFLNDTVRKVGDLVDDKVNEPVHEKTYNLGSDQVRHKPGYTVTEAGWKLEISDLRRRGIVLSV